MNENTNRMLKDLADLTRMQEELTAEIDKIKDSLKSIMIEQGVDELLGEGGEHCVFRPVISKRFDSTAFKKSEWAELYQLYLKKVETRPFRFYA